MRKVICVLCGEPKELDDMSVLAETKGLCGRDLGFVCKDCIEHIDNLGTFEKIYDEEVWNGKTNG
jgi:uncharacterized protein YlaI